MNVAKLHYSANKNPTLYVSIKDDVDIDIVRIISRAIFMVRYPYQLGVEYRLLRRLK